MKKNKYNILTTFVSQLVTTACGVVIPRVMIASFGSVLYGLTASITQFLSYISLLEGGMTSVARAELYLPLANKDDYQISRVYSAIKYFFTLVGVAFVIYTTVLSVVYFDIARVTEVGRVYTFLLVWIISSGTMAKYLVGLSNLTLLYADRKQYVSNLIVTIATVANALSILILSRMGCDLLVVKACSSILYVAQPICYRIYVKKHYTILNVGKDKAKLDQKWTGMGQHIAYFLHRNVDVVILTLFANLRWVAVYSVYKLVVTSIRNITGSFSSGMEAAFGEKIARKEQTSLQSLFFKYKHLLSFMSIVLFGTTAVLVVPFVRLYTAGVTDADYIQPAFAIVMLFAEAIDCFMHPCCSLPVAANKLKETRWGSYGEAIINITLSLVLVWWNPLVGVALATLIATGFKAVFYMVYAGRNILQVRLAHLMKSFLVTAALIALFAAAGIWLQTNIQIENYFIWVLYGIGTVGVTSLVTASIYAIVYPAELKTVLISVLRKFRRR